MAKKAMKTRLKRGKKLTLEAQQQISNFWTKRKASNHPKNHLQGPQLNKRSRELGVCVQKCKENALLSTNKP